MFNLTYSEISVRENSSQKGPCFFFLFFLKVVLLYKIWIWKSHEVQIGKTCHDTISFRAFWYRLWITTLGQSESLVLFQFWFVEMRWQDACECRCRFQGKSWILLHRNKSFFFLLPKYKHKLILVCGKCNYRNHRGTGRKMELIQRKWYLSFFSWSLSYIKCHKQLTVQTRKEGWADISEYK